MYIPIVIAMAMQLDVRKALSGGAIALIAAVITVVVCGLLVALLNRTEPVPLASGHDSVEPV
jgi:malonate transporter MadL subunit